MNTMVVQQTRFWRWFWNGLRLLTVVAMVAGMLPLDALAAPAAEAPAATTAAAPAANLLPGWMQPGPAARSATLLPAWLAEPAADSAAKLLPAWYQETTPAGAKPRPKQLDIPEALLTVNVYGPPVASLGAPEGFGEVYTVVVRNNSTQIAHNFYLTATYPTFFVYDGAEQLVHSISGTLGINTTSGAGVAQWQPWSMANLAPGTAVTLTFRLRATCAAQSGQMMRVWFYYNADPPPALPVEYNQGALNITTGRGNLVIRKDPALQNLGTPDFGQPVTWTVTVQNTGLGLIYSATVTDTGGINLGQPGGDLVPAVTIPLLGINETRQFTVVGRVEACNFTNVAETAWPCGNLVGDATFTNPLRSTASILFTPQVPNVNLQVTSPITEPYCTPLTRTVTITINNTGGPAGAFRLDSALESNGYWELVPGSLPAGWQYLSGSGIFTYTGGSPTGTLPAAGQAGLPVVLSFQLRPQATALCGATGGEIGFLPLYQDVCSHAPFTGTPVSLIYQSAQGGAPTISVDKSGPGLVHVGELITYVVTLDGSNPQSINGAITVTDLLPSPFALVSLTATGGIVSSAGQTVTWLYDPPDSGAFPQTLIYVARVLTTTGGVCGGSNIYDNDVLARANPTCPGCAQLVSSDRVTTAIENNEGVTASSGAAGSTEVCGVNGLVISRRYEVSGSLVITWTGSRFTETLGQGPGGLPGPAYLVYQAGSLAVTINGVDYTAALTPVTTTGQLVLDLTPLQTAVPAVPTQNVTLLLTYTLGVPESVLSNAVEVDFYDWARLFMIGVSDNQACATNGAFNQALPLHLSRGDLQVGLSPLTLNRCQTNQVTLSVTDNQPTRLADHIVITFTASTAEIMSARNFSYTGSLAAISPIAVVTQAAIGGGLGIITFTLPANADLNGNGTILFDVDLRCGEGVPWTAGIVFQSRCAITHGHQTVRDHLYREPGLLLFATPLQYTVREKQVIWKFFVTNNGNLPATNVQVTNELYGLAVISYTADQGGAGISVSGTLPITTPAVFTVASLAPGEQRAVTVTAEVVVCNPLTVELRARYSCFGAVCNEPQAQVNFNTPDPYLLTNNGETAALPMCDIGQIVFTTKNSSPDVTLYNLFITETLRGLLPIPGAPMTVTIEDRNHNILATTTQFTPLQQWSGSDLLLIWRPISAPTEVLSWFLALPPLYVVRIFVPVRTSCVPPNTPQSFAAASAQGPCGRHLSYTENAVSLQTLRPDMNLNKDGQVEGGPFGKTLYALPGDTIIWRLRVRNLPYDRAYVAHNVVLSDTWPAIFNFITATTAYTPHIDPATRTITWTLGDVGIGSDIYFYLTGTVAVSSTACLASALNRTQLSFGCDDGCASTLVPQDSANLSTAPNLVLALAPLTFQLCDSTITLTVRNQGAAAFTNTLTMTIPSGYVYDGLVSSGLAVTQIYTDPSAPRFYWDLIPGSEPNQPYSFDLVVRVVNSGTVGTCPNANGQPVTATIGYDDHPTCTDSGPFQATTNRPLTVLSPNLVIDKTPPFRTAQVGERITWTLRMTNTGTGLAAQVLITDVVDSSFTGVTATNGGLVTGNVITWTLTDLAVNGVWTAQVSAVLLSSGDNRNVVTATAYCASGCTSASTQASAQVTLLQEFQKNPKIQTGTIGSLVVFTFTAALPDVDALYTNLILTDTLPNGLGYVASELRYTYDADGSSGSPVNLISPTPTLSPTYLQPGNLIWRLGTLPGSIQVAGVVTAVIRDIASNYNGVRVTNLLSMTYVDDGQPYVYTDTANVDIVEPLLNIRKTVASSTGSVNALDGNALLTYTLRLTNTGTSPAYDVIITDVLPSWISVTALYGGDERSGPLQGPGFLTWTVAVMSQTLPGLNNPLVLTYTARISGAVPAISLTNRVSATWTSLPGNPFPGQERPYGPITDTQVVTTTPLLFTKFVTPSSGTNTPFRLGDLVTYTLVVTVAPGLYIPWPFMYDDLPAGVRYVVNTFGVTSTMPFIGPDPLASAASYESVPNGVQGSPSTTNPRVGRSEASAAIETVEWWLDPLNNSQSATPGLVTVTFQAQLTGIAWDGTVQWLNPQAVNTLNNVARLHWNNQNWGVYTSTQPLQILTSTVSSYVGQPLLHINKSYVTPVGCNATLLEDAFNAAALSGWSTATGGWNINTVPGYAQQSTTANPAILYRTGFNATDFSYSAMLYSTDSSSSRGLVFRYTDNNNHYRLRMRDNDGGTDVLLERVAGGLVTPVFTSTALAPDVNIWYHVEVRYEGGRIRAYVGGQLLVDWTDPTPLAAGSVGLYANNCSNNICYFDDVFVTRLNASSCYVGAGDLVTYTLTISNQGVMPAYNVVVSDVLPAELTFVTATLLSAPAGTTFTVQPVAGATGVITWELNVISGTSPNAFNYGNQQTVRLQVVARVTDTVAANTRFSNQVFLPYYDSQPGPGPTGTPISSGTDADQRTYSDGSHSAGLQTLYGGLLKAVAFAPPPTATLGTLVTYTLLVPATPITATYYNVVVTDTIDSRLRIEGVEFSGGTGGAASWFGQLVTATFATIPAGTQALITVTARISHEWPNAAGDANAGQTITNVAVMTSSTTPLTTSNVVSTVVGEPLLSIFKTAGALANPQTALYTVTVVNNGSAPAYSLVITDTPPAGITVTNLFGNGVLAPDGRTITWTVASLGVTPPGNTVVFTYLAQLTEAIYASPWVTNTATVRNTSLTETIPGVRPYITNTSYPLNWPLGRLGDYVWYDFDYNGIQGTHPGEFPIGGVVLDLFDSTTGAYISSTTTNASGYYIFQYLPLNVTYTVRISDVSYLPGGPLAAYTQTLWLAPGSTPANDSNASITATFGGLGYAITTTLTPAFTQDLTLDYGFVRLVEIGNYVWLDINHDGIQNDDTIYGRPGVTLTVTYPDGRVFTTTTDTAGYYTFTVPISSVYTITVIAANFQPGGPLETFTNTLRDAGGDDAVDSDGQTSGGGLVTVTPVITQNNYTFDFGVWQPMQLGDYIWYDWNNNGITDTGESGIPGVVVELYRDTNGDGVFTPGVDQIISTTTTNAAGYYLFNDLTPSLYPTQTYLVVITGTNFTASGVLSTYVNSTGYVTGNSDLNSHDHGVVYGTPGSGGYVASTPVSLTLNSEPVNDGDTNPNSNLTIDFGFYRLSLGDLLWYDYNNNGIYEPWLTEAGVPGVVVELYRAGQTPGVDTPLLTTTTNAAGRYLFTGLAEDLYFVHIPLSEFGVGRPLHHYTSTIPTQVNPNTDANENVDENGIVNGYGVSSGIITLTVTTEPTGEDVAGIDGGTPDNNSNLTVDFGFFNFVSLGNYVWYDVNNNGVAETGEAPVPGVVVELYQDTNGDGLFTPGVDTYLGMTTTNASGLYLFPHLLPTRYPTETYLVVITGTNFLPGAPLYQTQSSDGSVDGNSDLNNQDHGVVAGTLGAGGYVASTAVTLTVGGEPINDDDTDANSNLTLDFGFYRLSLGDFVWYDVNNNGLWDTGEAPASGITVRLVDATGTTVLMTTTTDANGLYTFTGLLSATYYVEIVIPATYTSSTDIASSANPNNNVNNDDNGVTFVAVDVVRSGPVTFVPGDHGALNNNTVTTATGSTYNPTVDFGLVHEVSLGNYVWYDVNNNGVAESGEAPVPGVVVELYQDTNGDGLFTPGVDTYLGMTTTNASGLYLFPHLLPTRYPTETYLVVITSTNFLPGAPLYQTQSSDGSVGGDSDLNNQDHGVVAGTLGAGGYVASTAVTLTVGGEPIDDDDTDANSNLTLDFGFYQLSLGDQVWYDDNNNGMLDGGEVGAPGVTVRLVDATGTTVLMTTTTDAHGFYTFTGLLSATYYVEIVIPATYTSSTDIATSGSPDNNVNSDDNGVTFVAVDVVRSGPVTLVPGDSGALSNTTVNTATGSTYNPTVDFGLYALVSLGNYVWYDVNNNGLAETGEAPVPGVVMELYQDTNGDGVFTPGVDTYLGMTTTNASGYYLFPDLLPTRYPTQAYLVVVTGTNFLPGAPLYQTRSSDGSVDGDSDLNNQDHGVVAGTLGAGGYVASTAVTLTAGDEPPYTGYPDDDSDTRSNLTIDFGFYRLSLGDFVWYDVNNNGLWDTGEAPAPGITVRLVDATGTTVLLTTTTDANGLYTFTGLLSATYYVEIVIPATYTSSTDIASSANPDNNVNSDDNGVTFVAADVVRSGPVTLVPGDSGALGNNAVLTPTGSTYNPTVDFGLVPGVSLGNYVWYDVNNNGLAETGEAPVRGVVVELYQDTNGDGIFTPGVDTYLGMTTTNASGLYLFPNLLPTRYPTETYLVVITGTNFLPGAPLYQYQNSDGSVDGDSDLNNQDHGVVVGTLGAGGYVASTAVTLTVGGEPIDDDDTDANSNLTLDFGFYQLGLGNQVWLDANNDGLLNNGEVGLPGIEVRLYDITGTLIATTTTGVNGYYSFTGLLSGTYVVEIVPPAVYTSSTDIGSSGNPDNNVDNDDNGVNWLTGTLTSNPITLVPGDSGALSNTTVNTATGSTFNPTVDFGLYSLVSLGDYVWYDVNNNGLVDTGEVGVPGVVVELYQDTNGDGVFTPGVDTYLSMTTTNASGYYLFPDLLPSLTPTGTYLVVITSTNFLPGAPLYQTQNSDGSVGGNSDLNNQDHGVVAGTLGAGGYVASTAVSLTVGGEPINDGDTNPNSNLTIDFGFYQLSLGDFVWYDANNNGLWDSSEAPAQGITVRLVDATGTTVLMTTTTDANGLYTFTGLLSGTYRVEIVIPAAYTSSTDIASSGNPNNNVNSDDNGVTFVVSNVVQSGPVTLVPGDSGALNNNAVLTPTGSTHNPTVDFGLVQLFPAIDLDKTVLPGLAAPHMPFTYVIVISNVGQLTLDPLILTDTLPAGFHYQVGTGDPADPDLIAEPLLRWNNLGALPPGGVITISFAVTVERGILGTFYNVATVEGDHPGGTITDTDDVPIVIQDPAIDMSKQLIGYDTDLVAPNFITFTIEMTNIGPTPINVLPLVDHYDPYYLSFATATPYPDEPDDDGLLTWYNLVGPAPHGFGRYLLPGQTFVVTTVFRIAHDIIDITTTNIATTTGVTDIYTNPTTDQTDHVDVPGTDGGIPTAVDLLSFRATGLEQAIRLEWATAAEINNFGFRVLRAAEPEYTRASELVFIPSLCRGNLCGATYVYTDTTALPETAYWYWLVDVDTDGRQTRHGPASAQIGLLMAKFKLYLPLVLKAQ